MTTAGFSRILDSIDCLVGDVIKDMSAFTAALEQMTPPPPPLGASLRPTAATRAAQELKA